jgi:ATP-dependent DNA ligase
MVMLPIPRPLPPMEARAADALPGGEGWQYEPKWDGFRCIAYRDGTTIELQSKGELDLTRYFPDVAESLRGLGARHFVLDGEIVIATKDERALSFDDLLLRIHPAASRVKKLAAEKPAMLIVFDLLADERGRSLMELPLVDRRARLEKFAARYLAGHDGVALSPASERERDARGWLESAGAGLDGVMAKRIDMPYQSGERTGMVKVKHMRTAECVVGGFRYAQKEKVVGSLLLGLFEKRGVLHHVGFSSNLPLKDRKALTPRLEALAKEESTAGFTGRAPGGPSRWSRGRTTDWQALPHTLVVEVQYDHFSGGRFRHGATFLRWRPDKKPTHCTFGQIRPAGPSPLRHLQR